jgi:hypothetical protein
MFDREIFYKLPQKINNEKYIYAICFVVYFHCNKNLFTKPAKMWQHECHATNGIISSRLFAEHL